MFLHPLVQRILGYKSRGQASKRPAPTRLRLELLEDRTLLTSLTWLGPEPGKKDPDPAYWSIANNWQDDDQSNHPRANFAKMPAGAILHFSSAGNVNSTDDLPTGFTVGQLNIDSTFNKIITLANPLTVLGGTWANGTIQGKPLTIASGKPNASNTFTWSGGTLAGTLTVSAAAQLTIDGKQVIHPPNPDPTHALPSPPGWSQSSQKGVVLSHGTLDIQGPSQDKKLPAEDNKLPAGVVIWSSGIIWMVNDSNIENHGQLQANQAAGPIWDPQFNDSVVENLEGGTFKVDVRSFTQNPRLTLYVTFNNKAPKGKGGVIITGGSLVLAGGGANSGYYEIWGSGRLYFAPYQKTLTYSWNTGTQFDVNGLLGVSTGTFEKDNKVTNPVATISVPNSAQIQVVGSGVFNLWGNILNAGAVMVDCLFVWESGTIKGGILTLKKSAYVITHLGTWDTATGVRYPQSKIVSLPTSLAQTLDAAKMDITATGSLTLGSIVGQVGAAGATYTSGVTTLKMNNKASLVIAGKLLLHDSSSIVSKAYSPKTQAMDVKNASTLIIQGNGKLIKDPNKGTSAFQVSLDYIPDKGSLDIGEGSAIQTPLGMYRGKNGFGATSPLIGGGGKADPEIDPGGTITGEGTIGGELITNAGTIDPGGQTTTGLISIDGDYTQISSLGSGALSIGIAGTTVESQYDQLAVTGNATLGGTLNVSLLNGFTPTLGQTFQILTYASHTGDFQTVTGLTFGSYRFDVQYNSTNVTLVVVSSNPSAPTVTGISPSTGTTAGGTSVTVTGTNFTDMTGVSFGTTPAASFTVNSSTSITAVAPSAAAAGTVDITVTNEAGTSSTSSADQFTYTLASAPTVTAVSPSLGGTVGNDTVTITGANFLGTTAVNFGTNPALYFVINSATQITAYSASATPGTVDVTVTTAGGTSTTSPSDQFTYASTPVITGLNPSFGSSAGGPQVTITGSGFTDATDVSFGGLSAQFTVSSDTSITALIPPQVAGTVDVTVTTGSGTSALVAADRFTYAPPSNPAVTGLTTTTGTTAGGTPVTVNGSGFTGASEVAFGTVPATNFIINSDSQITAIAPPQAAGSVDVAVVSPTGTSAVSSSDQFTYTAASLPAVTGLSTTSGTTGGGTTVTISGSGFTGVTGVNFGSLAATGFTFNSDGSITATSPAQDPNPLTVDVTVTTPAGTSTTNSGDQFTYTAAAAPTVTAITPTTGPTAGGTVVSVTGTGFTGASSVTFGGVAATNFMVNSDTSLTATAPAGLNTGAVDVQVTTPTGTSATGSGDQFTYTATALPTVTSLGTTSGSTAGGTQVVVNGSGFTTASEIDFGTVPVYDFTVNSDSQITVLAPSQPAGTVDVTVVNYSGPSATNTGDRFTYNAAAVPAVTSLGTTSGSTGGGTSVTVNGSGFTGATTVMFGSLPAQGFTFNSDGSLTAISPAQDPSGAVDVTVTTPTGTSAVNLGDQFSYTAAPAPAVTSLATTSGTTGGGTLVTINGTNFTGASQVMFGTVAATDFWVNSDSSVTAISPPQNPTGGTVDVTVTTPTGTSTTNSGDQFSYTPASAPAVSAVSPATGTTPGGTQVTITGSGFTGASAVTFGGIAASDFTVNSDTSITALSPPEAAGTVHIQVTTPTGTSATGSGDQFTYTNVTAPAPAVTAVGPNTGASAGGQVVTLTGTNFSGATAVSFGGTAASSFTINSDTQITATAPAHSTGTIDVQVTTNNGTSSTGSSDQFTYLSAAAPAVTSLGTTSGSTAGGTSVTVNGSGFTGATAVLFGGTAGTNVNVVSDSQLTVTSPADPAGVVDVQVVTPSGTSATNSNDQFTYTAASAPTVTSLGTSSGSTAGGTSVVITGTNLAGAVGVYFGGVPASSFTVNSGTQVTATSPAGYAGTVDVTVATFAGTSAPASGDRFSYTLATGPSVTSLSPSTGSTAGGTSVTVTGSGFTSASAVSFGTVPASSFTVNSDTSITAVSPSEAAGTVPIIVTTPSGSSPSVSASQFTYTAAAAPTVTGVSPSTGSTGGGTSVTITGTGFTGATAVSFGSVAAADFTVNSDTSITATSPAQDPNPLTVDVTVTTPSGTSATGSADHFTYSAAAAPAVSSITPASGPTAGGTVVTVLGSGFTGASAVTFGGVAASSFTFLSDGALTAVAPVGSAGTVDVQVTTPTGTSTTGTADHFTYTASGPSVTSLDPATGPTGGGAVVTVSGSGFTYATAVNFGGTPATSFYVASDSTLVATAPPDPAGSVDVTVVNADGSTSALSAADQFVYTANLAPAVTSLGTSTGTTAGGTSVTVNGSGFTGVSGVSFGTVPASSFVFNSDSSITAVAPPQSAGTVDVIVTTPTGTSATGTADHFSYTNAAAPVVSGVTPSGGSTAGGMVVSVNGSGFTGVTGVTFGGVAAAFTFQNDGWLTAVAPPQDPNPLAVDVQVTTPSGTSVTSANDKFTYSAATGPAVTGVTPNTGSAAGGTLVTVNGSGFTGASAVNFGGNAAADFTVLSDNSLTAYAPAGTAGTVDVTVVTPTGTSATGAADHFTYTAVPVPTVTAVGPTSGTSGGGTAVVVTGTGFSTATGVSFGAYPASSFIINSDTQLTAIVPAQDPSPTTVDVTVTDPAGTSATGTADHFTYNVAALPSVTGISPSSGPTGGGTSVAITGTGFLGASAVMFGSVAASSFTVNSDTSVFATAPAEAAGTVDITVQTPSGTSATGAADQFTFQADPALTASPQNQSLTVGVPFSGSVASFTDADPGGTASQFTAVINWGNGAVTVGSVTQGGSTFYVQPNPSFTYASAGTYSVTVQIYDAGGASASTVSTFTVSSGGLAPARPAPVATGTTATATHGVAFGGSVASFAGSIAGGTAANYTVSINWGNGHTTAGTVVRTGDNTFGVVGFYTYAAAGLYKVTITITDSSGDSTTVTTTLLVADARDADAGNELESAEAASVLVRAEVTGLAAEANAAGAAADVLTGDEPSAAWWPDVVDAPAPRPAAEPQAEPQDAAPPPAVVPDDDGVVVLEPAVEPAAAAAPDAVFVALGAGGEDGGQWQPAVAAEEGPDGSGWAELATLPVAVVDAVFNLLQVG